MPEEIEITITFNDKTYRGTATADPEGFALLLENADRFLTEAGDFLLLE